MNKIALLSMPMLLVLALVSINSTVLAQSSNGGLKLGDPAPQNNTLDLGARPAASGQSTNKAPRQAQQSATTEAAKPQLTRHGDWDVACSPQGSDCAMAQIGNDDTGTPILEMVVRKLEEPLEIGERTAFAVLDIITPLGVVLPEGVTMTIDSGREESALFQICTEQGCLVREPVDNDLIDRLKRGNSAVISVVAASRGKVTSSLSLAGFTKAYNSL